MVNLDDLVVGDIIIYTGNSTPCNNSWIYVEKTTTSYVFIFCGGIHNGCSLVNWKIGTETHHDTWTDIHHVGNINKCLTDGLVIKIKEQIKGTII